MARQRDHQMFLDQFAALKSTTAEQLRDALIENPQLAEAVADFMSSIHAQVIAAEAAEDGPPDGGLSELAGIGPDAADEFGDTRIPPPVEPYDEHVASERIVALGDLYYLYQHEKIGVFKVVRRLRELFRAGAVRLSSGSGAFRLYQFDRRGILRYTQKDRLAAYRRAFGYGSTKAAPSALPNTEFHGLFTHFINQVTLYWRDKRISDVIRERAHDPSFGSIAVVRRAGLDLRNNLSHASYGHLNVLRVEVMQLLEEAFDILRSEDVMRLFGSENAWEVIEDVLRRYFNQNTVSSPRQRMAVAGRNLLHWLAQAHILEETRPQFESNLIHIADEAEEWLTSAQSLGFAERGSKRRVQPWDRPSPRPRSPASSVNQRVRRNGAEAHGGFDN